MRQKLPESQGYSLLVGDIGREVFPGDEFDAPSLVPGCVSLEPAEDEAPGGADGGAGAGEGEDASGGDEPAQDASEPRKTRAKGTRP